MSGPSEEVVNMVKVKVKVKVKVTEVVSMPEYWLLTGVLSK